MSAINISPSLYKHIRDQTINDDIDALIEIITNSYDAYLEVNRQIKPIDIYWENNQIIVIDQALGLFGSKMAECFLQIGNYTSMSGHRGFFSRGAKDVTALGNIEIHSIKDGLYSQITLSKDLIGKLVVNDQTITSKIRNKLKIYQNGVYFQINLDAQHILSDKIIQKHVDQLENHFSLRHIMTDVTYKITSHYLNINKVHYYQSLEGKLIVQMTGNLSDYGYPEAIYTFKLWQTETEIGDPVMQNDNRFIKFGILTQTTTNIHDNGSLYPQIRYEPNMGYLYGTLDCDYIDILMEQHLNQSNDANKNPYPPIDAGRVNGLKLQHPFIKALYEKPYQRLIYIINDMVTNDAEDSDLVLNNLSDLFDDLDDEITQNLKPLFGRFNEKLVDQVVAKIIKDKTILNENSTLKYSTKKIKQYSDKEGDVEALADNGEKGKDRLQIIPHFTNKEINNSFGYRITKGIKGYTILISISSSSLHHYLYYDDQHKLQGLSNPLAKISIAYILSMAIAELLANNNFKDTNLAHYSSYDVINKINVYENKVKNKIFDYIVQKF